jgi:hypothetical protein
MSNDGQNPDEDPRPDEHGDSDASRPPPDTGFRMLDWLTLPAGQRELVVWLTRHSRATREELVSVFGEGVDALLEEMLAGGYINVDSSAGEAVFTVVYRTHQKRATREFPDDIWSRVDSRYSRSKGSSDDTSDSDA